MQHEKGNFIVTPTVDLSVILISKNQAWNIGRLIESVLRETQGLASREILLVDSASTDATVNVARCYPVQILRLHTDQHLGPAAGRYVGFRHCCGRLVLFIDGDAELYPRWLGKARQVLEEDPGVAAVSGRIITRPPTAATADAGPVVDVSVDRGATVQSCGGMALYRRSVLDVVGCFHPYLYSEEEPELCIRIRRAGYRIVQLEHPVAYEYSTPKGELATMVGRWKRNLYLGVGQNLRQLLGSGGWWWYVRERGFGLLPLLWAVLGLAAIGMLFAGQARWLAAFVVVTASVILVDLLRRRSIRETASSLLDRLLWLDGTVRGFCLRSLRPESYPGRHDVIERAPIEGTIRGREANDNSVNPLVESERS